jgi:flagellar biosynthesis chaperone FliJ
VYEYNLDFYNRNGYWKLYKLDGAAQEVTDAEDFVEEVEKAIKQVAAAVDSEKEKMEKTLVEYLKKQFLD